MLDPTVTLNGEHVPLPAHPNLVTLLAGMPGGLPSAGVAVAVDGAVVPRGEWDRRPLRGGEAVEVVTAVQGG